VAKACAISGEPDSVLVARIRRYEELGPLSHAVELESGSSPSRAPPSSVVRPSPRHSPSDPAPFGNALKSTHQVLGRRGEMTKRTYDSVVSARMNARRSSIDPGPSPASYTRSILSVVCRSCRRSDPGRIYRENRKRIALSGTTAISAIGGIGEKMLVIVGLVLCSGAVGGAGDSIWIEHRR